MAIYAAAFNVAQDRYKIHVVYDDRLAANLSNFDRKPTLAVGRFLKGAQVRSLFQSLDYLFSELVINQSSFYDSLLELGNVDGRQLLLPVSFNLPLVIFDSARSPSLPDNFVLSLSDLESQGAAYNQSTKQSVTRMGFGPRWSADFLYEALRLYNSDFREGAPLQWNQSALEAGIANLRDWSAGANGSVLAEDEFQFKYLYLPPHRSVQDGRIGFAALSSAEYFVIPVERKSNLSFRWLAKDGFVPVADDPVYIGILRSSRGKGAAEAFLKWFFSDETQKSLLDDARRNRSMESSFGLAGGFSSIKTVNEKFFSQYYPSLLGKMPPSSYLKTAAILPADWPAMKHEVILPFLLAATGPNPPENLHTALGAMLAAWVKHVGNR